MPRKSKVVFVCDSCGAESARWEGRCRACGEWNTLAEFRAPAAASAAASARRGGGGSWAGDAPAEAVRLRDVSGEERERMAFQSAELNRVLGGGMVAGSVSLLAGDPGIGKSTLLLSAAADAARRGPALYVSGEESAAQVKLRADRMSIAADDLYLLPATNLDDILARLDDLRPALAVVDSIQTVADDAIPSEAGSVAQIRECARRLTRWAKSSGGSVVMTGHVTKGGDIAGPRVLEHVVDAVLHLEGDPVSAFRLLRSVKNRFGSTNEVGIYEMTERGLEDVADPSQRLISERADGAVGSIVIPTIEGTRPLLVEMQALTNPSLLPAPRRVASGVDYNRLLLTCAVLTRRAGLSLANQDVIVNVAGGVRVSEPAADLAMALAIVSSVRDIPIRAGTAAVGELGLGGEARAATQIERRINEAARLGLRRCLAPASADFRAPKNVEIVKVASLRDAIGAALTAQRRARRFNDDDNGEARS